MIYNSRYVPGVLPNSFEAMHTPTQTAEDLFLHVEYIGHAHCSPEYSVIRRKYCHYLLMYIMKGKVVFTTEGQTYEAEAGQTFLIETQKPHIYGAIGTLEALWVHFNGKDFHPFFEHLWSVNHGQPVFDTKNNTEFFSKFQDLVHSFATSRQYPEIIVSAKLYEILGLLLTKQVFTDSDSIDKVVQYINRHYPQTLTLEMLAQKANLSVSRFCALFKKETGYSPYKYIINTRLHASRQYLANSTHSIEYIATHVGFADASSFIASFRQKYKITPRKFRAKLNGGH